MPTATSTIVRSRLLVLCLASLAAACTESTFAPEHGVLTVAAEDDTLSGDGVSSTLVRATLPPSLPQDATVEFSTSLGRFATPAGAPDRKVAVRARGGTAEARLLATGETGTAHVTVTGAGSSAQTSVVLAASLPTVIDLRVDRTAAPADGVTPVSATAVLRRAAGAVSGGIPVRFEARDSATGAPLSGLSGVAVADSGGSATFKLTTTVPRTVELRAFAGAAQSEPRIVRFTPPPAASAARQRADSTLLQEVFHERA